MPDLLIKNIGKEVLGKLKAQAQLNSCNLEDEIKIILKDAAQEFTDDELARKIKDYLRGYNHSDSAKLSREDRMR